MVEIVLRTETGNRLWTRLRHRNETLHAPHVIDLEVANALRRCLARGEVDDRGGDTALVNLGYVQIERHPHQPLLERIWQFRHNLTAYDAAYLALAERLDASLLTLDSGLVSVAGHHARVEIA